MRLNLEATYMDDASYNVSGTLEYAGETYTVEGEVLGGGEQRYLKPMTSPLPEASFEINASDTQGEVRWRLIGSPPSDDPQDDSAPLAEMTLEGSLGLAEGVGPSRFFFLERQP